MGRAPVEVVLLGDRAEEWAAMLGLPDRVRTMDRQGAAPALWVLDAETDVALVPASGVLACTGSADLGRLAAAARRVGPRREVWLVPRVDASWLAELVAALDAGESLLGFLQGLGQPFAPRAAQRTTRAGPPTTVPLPTAGPPPTAGSADRPDPPRTQTSVELRTAPGSADPPGAADRRRLVADISASGRRCTKALPPDAPATLEVSLKIPRRGQLAADAPLDLPAGPEPVVLDVVASGSVWAAPLTRQVWVPMNDRDQPSTIAAFDFVTGDDGALVSIRIDVLLQGKPLQRVDVAAVVRAVPLAGDRVRVASLATSSGPLPRPGPAAALPEPPGLVSGPGAVTLDATSSDLINVATGAAVPLHDAEEVLDSLGLILSRTLGATDAPEDLRGEASRTLLVSIARRGAQLVEKLAPLGIGAADSVNLLVTPETTLLPLELCYDGPAPQRGARVCAHGSGQASCPGPSARVVCPHAFWGLRRSVCRTVLLQPRRVPPPPSPLQLSRALYAATTRADAESPAADPPTDSLARALHLRLGQVTRVRSWRAWRRAVREHQPGLLLLLAHTEESAGERFLQIGAGSLLSSIDLRPSDVRTAGAPPPLVVLVSCATAQAGDAFGSFHGALTARGAAAVVGTLAKLNGPQGARAAAAVVASLADAAADGSRTLGDVLADARRDLLAQGLLVGLLLVAHGELDTGVLR